MAKGKKRPGPKSKTMKKTEEEFEIDGILGLRYNHEENGLQYLVKWKGYSMKACHWESEENVANASVFVDPYHEAAEYLRDLLVNQVIKVGDADTDGKKLKDHWEVEYIQGVELDMAKNRVFCWIKWKDWTPVYNTLEPRPHLTNCPEAIKPFEKAIDAIEDAQDKFKDELPPPFVEPELDDEEVSETEEEKYKEGLRTKKKAGPKSKTKKAGPKSKTVASKKPGPKSRTVSPKKKAGPKSRTMDDENTSPRRGGKRASGDDDDEVASPKRGRGGAGDAATPASKKRPGPRSRTMTPRN
ncbi:hypothetical protein HDE_14585 [Halotydeus destructor]|nr:hypothetical protein HDE_14585 [Halotydeus destructor]